MSAYITNFYEQHQTIIIYFPSTLWLSCKRKLTTVAEDRPVQLAHFEFSRSNCNGLRLNFAKCSKVKWKCSSLRMRLSAFSGDVRTKSMLWLYHCVVGLEGNLKDTVFQCFLLKLFFRFPLPQSGYIFIPRTGFLMLCWRVTEDRLRSVAMVILLLLGSVNTALLCHNLYASYPLILLPELCIQL